MDASTSRRGASRRTFIAGMSGAGLAAAVPFARADAAAIEDVAQLIKRLQTGKIADESFWAKLKSAFSLRAGLIHLNSANLAPASRPVMAKAVSAAEDVNSDPSFENRIQFEKTAAATRSALANMLNVDADEIAVTRNTSESNRTVIDGANLAADDEVVIWDQNHESNGLAWDVWARRRGFRVVRVATPRAPAGPAALIEPFHAALSERTKVLAFSHVSNVSGVALPAAELCRIAAERDILTLVDGAQTFGMMALDLKAMGCDFFTASAHKWLTGPHETGVLYVRASRIESLWPSMVTHNWETMASAGAQKFECLGQRQDGRIEALAVAVAIHQAIGGERVERRIRFLADYLRSRLKSAGKPVEFLTPTDPAMNAGILMFFINTKNAAGVMRALYEKHNVSALALPAEGRTLIRFSPNIYNTLEELDVAVAAVASLA